MCYRSSTSQLIVSLEKCKLAVNPVESLKETFVKTNTALMVTPISYMTSGSTCVAAYMVGSHLYVANSGDSRAVMCTLNADGSVVAKNLTRDHKPDDPDEMARITAWGGFVAPPPCPGMTARVYLDPEAAAQLQRSDYYRWVFEHKPLWQQS